MHPVSDVSSIGHLIQLSVAPVFLLTAIGAILNVLSSRLARAVDRARTLEARYDAAPAPERETLQLDLKVQARRARMIYWAMSLCALCALLVCADIIALFASAFVELELALLTSLLFVAAMLAFMAAMLVLLREVRLATTNLRIGPP